MGKCSYCHDKNLDGTKMMKGKSYNILGDKYDTAVYLRETNNNLVVEFGNEEIFSKKINYCPMCGRKLNTD